MTTRLPLPSDVAAAFEAMPSKARARLLSVRRLIFETAETVGAGALIETLKWGEPAYLTKARKMGTPLRLGLSAGRPAVFFNCQTTLVAGFRSDFPDVFEYMGNRALVLPDTADQAALGLCLSRALTYHRDKVRKRVSA